MRQMKTMIGDLDLLIASTCLYYNLTLLTNKKCHIGVTLTEKCYR
ncbi:MAG: hypothetical protein R3B44_00450 [Candidatus Brocadiaceae bacterium]